jgi:hypothetical protein
MSGKMIAEPVWVGLAIRMADGMLYAVEIDQDAKAELDLQFDAVEDWASSFAAGYRIHRLGPDIHVRATVSGIGRKVERFGPDMGADHQPKSIEPDQRAIEQQP